MLPMSESDPQHQPQSKTSKQILIRKMKHIGQIDKEIRRNWKQLFKFMNQGKYANQNPEESPKRRLQTECIESKIHKQSTDPKKITSMHTEMKREKVHERKRKNEQIFFKKRTCDMNSLLKESKNKVSDLGFSLSKRYSLQIDHTKKPLQESVPFMLRRRTAKIEKQMGVIAHNYNDSLKKIKIRQDLKYSLSLQDRKHLIDGMKGTKVYYQFLKEWRSDQQQTV